MEKIEKIARFGYIWKHKKTGKLHGAKINVETIEELKEYEQVRKNQSSTEENPKEDEKSYFTAKSRRNE